MKFLILAASIGSGHMQAAEAIAEQFKMHFATSQVEVVDFMCRDVSFLNWLLKKLYLSALKVIPDLYDRIYRLAGVRRFGSITRLIWSTLMYLPFARLFNKFKPEVIICTHPFPEAAAALWKFLHPKSNKSFTLAAVLTDYSLHEIWIYGGVDLYFVATEEMRRELESHGQFNVFATGIPIRSQFCNQAMNEDSLCIKHSVLIMGGGLGLGAFEETIIALAELNFKLKVIVITGKNERLQNRLKTLKTKHELLIYGFVENISEVMRSVDVLITKPGALTLSEAFAVGLPILLLPPIPGPEALNAEFAVEKGVALSLKGTQEISEALSKVYHIQKLQAMREAAVRLAKPSAAGEIVDLIRRRLF